MIELDTTYSGNPLRTYLDGVPTNPDSITGTIYRNGTEEAGVTVSFTNVTDGFYFASFTTLGTGDGWSESDRIVGSVDVVFNGETYSDTFFDSIGIAVTAITQVVVGRTTDEDADNPHLTCKVGEVNKPKSVVCTDAAGESIDLTDWGDKQVVIERATGRREDVQVIANAGITISTTTAANDTFSFQPDATVLAQPGDFRWSLREASSQDVIIDGRLTVSYSPMEDV